MTTNQATEERVPVRALVARAAAAIAMGVGVFGVLLAWGAMAGTVPRDPLLGRARDTASWIEGDAGVVVAALGAAGLPWLVSRVRVGWHLAAAAWGTSLLVGGVVGAVVMNVAREGAARVTAWGVTMWLCLATARAACALPLASLLGRGAPLASRDALDRVMLRAALWLLAAETEAAMVLRIGRPPVVETAGPALGVAFFGMALLTGLMALAALARSVRWFALWRRVLRGAALRLVASGEWPGAAPAEAWFEGLGASDAVAVRTVTREGLGYREGDVDTALARVPADGMRVAGGLLLRALAAVALLAAHVGVVAALVAPLRW